MIETALLMAFIDVESSFRKMAFLLDGNGGSYGFLQIDAPTAKDRGFVGKPEDLYDPFLNLKFGTAQLEWIISELTKVNKYSIDNLAAAYNSGLHHVLSGGTDGAYSLKISLAYNKWKALFP